jgi:DNA-binding response OmpR family regulator
MLVLVADDDPTTCALVATILKRAGHDALVAHDAVQVAWMVKQHRPDMLVLDLQMPGGTGVTALQRLKQSILTSAIPVVVLSGTTDQAAIDRVLAMGADEFLHKPVDGESLIAAVERASGNR